jgi:outer membrane protein
MPIHKNRSAILAVTLLSVAMSAQAEPALTIQEAWDSTLENNLQLRGEYSYVRGEDARVDEAWAAVKPQVDFTAGYGRTWYKREVGLSNLEEGQDNPTRLDVGVSQVIYSRSAFKGIDRAERSVDKEQARLNATREQVGAESLAMYLEVNRLQRLVVVVDDELAGHEQRANQAEEMLDRGFTTKAEALEARSRVDEVRAQLVKLENQHRTALQKLQQLVGRPVTRVTDVNEDLWRQTPVFLKADWQTLALGNAPRIQVAEAESRLAAAAYKVAAAGHYPELSLNARYTDNDSFATSLLEERKVELRLSVPIYKGGSTSARSRAARYREEGAEWLLASEREATTVEVQRLIAELNGSYNNIGALEQALRSARASEEAANEGFVAGVRNLVGLLDVRKRRSGIEQELIGAVYDNLSLRLQLLSLSGELSQGRLQAWNS